jgi:putative oxidoreductase
MAAQEASRSGSLQVQHPPLSLSHARMKGAHGNEQMNNLTTYAPLAARVLIGLLFLVAGLGKLGDVAGFSGYLASGGLPAFLAWPAVIFEIVLGVALIVGYQTRIMAFLGAGFCVLAGLLYHFQPADQMQMTMFLKNLAIAGGLLMFTTHGAGKLALDKA